MTKTCIFPGCLCYKILAGLPGFARDSCIFLGWEQGCRPIFTEVTLMWLIRFLPGTAGAHWGQLGKCDRWVTQGWFLLSPLPLPPPPSPQFTPGSHTANFYLADPWGLEELIVFSLCPFPDESAHVCQIWCQWVVIPDFWISDPLNPPPQMPPGG